MKQIAAFLLILLAAPTTFASPAIDRLFELQNMKSVVSQVIAALEAQHAAQVEQETDPKVRARKRAEHERVAKYIRGVLTWEKLRPVAVKSYADVVAPADVDALVAYYETPAGQLTLKRLDPTLLKTAFEAMQHLEAAATEISEREAGAPAPAVAKWEPANTRESVAAELATELMKSDFEARIGTIEDAMREQMMAFIPESLKEETEKEVQRMGGLIRKEVTFDRVKPITVRGLAANFSEDELQVLLADNRRPERRAQRALFRKAQAAFESTMQEWMKENVVPGLLKILREPE